MGIFGMPSTQTHGMKLNSNIQGQRGGRRTGRTDTVYAKVTLTIPPGWTSDDDTWLFPLVVEV